MMIDEAPMTTSSFILHTSPMIWRGRWIWLEQPPAGGLLQPSSIPPRETWNRFALLRRSFVLDRAPDHVPARVTADSRFVLFVNGVEVARGPARSMPERLTYAEIDLAPFLRTGENAIGALVRFYGAPVAWWRPAPPNGQIGFGGFLFEAPAIELISDGSWRCRPAPYAREVSTAGVIASMPTEVLDGGALPSGWESPDFDDSGWTPAVELRGGAMTADRLRVPAEPYAAMEADGIAPLTAL